jgi:hypothetical protein
MLVASRIGKAHYSNCEPANGGKHHLQLQRPFTSRAGSLRASIGQCSSGDFAFSRVGHPQPSIAGSRSMS